MARPKQPHSIRIFFGKDDRVYGDILSRGGHVVERLSGGKNGGYKDPRYVRTLVKIRHPKLKVVDETLSDTSRKANETKAHNLAHGAKHKTRRRLVRR